VSGSGAPLDWERLEALLEAALARPVGERAAILDRECRDPELRAELESLLAQAGSAERLFDALAVSLETLPTRFGPADLRAEPEEADGPTGIDPLLGRTVCHYRIESRLGGGGMGVVYRARDTRLEREVALKFLPPHLGLDPGAKERFLVEARAAAALDHPNICTVYEIGEAGDGRLFIAMACYDGETLRERIASGPLSVAEAVSIAAGIARGLAAAHARGVVHRDVKPGNVMLTVDGDVKLLDFGLAKVAEVTLTRPGITQGTVAYMSPEQVRGDPADARSDLWSLGVVVYEMLAGRRPFGGEHEAAVLHAIRHDEPEPVGALRPETPERLAAVVGRLLAKDPDDRYAGAEALLADLDRGADAASARPAKRRKVQAAFLAGAIVLAGAVVGIQQTRTGDRDGAWVARQLLEIDRLRGQGRYAAAFALATEVEPHMAGDTAAPGLWDRISWSADIESEPPGARVYRQPVDAAEGEWELLGTTPLPTVRFAEDEGYRLRFELEGHRPVELLHTAIRGVEWRGAEPLKPVRLNPVDVLPEGMVRIPGFTRGQVEYGDYFMDRFEVTNREYERLVAAGGYANPEHWVEPFVRNGEEVTREEAVRGFVDLTGRPGPSTWRLGTYPEGEGEYPVRGVSWYEAAAFARFTGKELPTTVHWEGAARFQREDNWIFMSRSNLRADRPRAVGENRALTTLGVYDLFGNVREWCWNEAGTDGRATRGGAWTDAPYFTGWIIPKSAWDRDPTHGIRLVRSFDDREALARLREPVESAEPRDYQSEEPASDEEFRIYRRLYDYDPQPLDARVEAVDTFEHWTRETVAFDLLYGERGGAFLYLPRNADPPFEVVLFWGTDFVFSADPALAEYLEHFDFLMRSGRAVAQPVFKGAFGRRDDSGTGWFRGSLMDVEEGPVSIRGTRYRDHQIKWVQELRRTIDYLETRDDIDPDRLGYYSVSWGSTVAPIALAVETRIDAAVLVGGGLGGGDIRWLPEIDPFNFLPRVRTPVLMLNGEYDIVAPLETSQKPMYRFLGTDPQHKKHYVAAATHILAQDELIRETLDWFDRYLGGSPD